MPKPTPSDARNGQKYILCNRFCFISAEETSLDFSANLSFCSSGKPRFYANWIHSFDHRGGILLLCRSPASLVRTIFSTVHFSTVHFSTVHFSTVQYLGIYSQIERIKLSRAARGSGMFCAPYWGTDGRPWTPPFSFAALVFFFYQIDEIIVLKKQRQHTHLSLFSSPFSLSLSRSLSLRT